MTPLRLDTIPHYWRCRKCESTDPHVHEVRGEDGLLHWQDHSYDIRDELTRLRAELAEVTKDAERWNAFIRENPSQEKDTSTPGKDHVLTLRLNVNGIEVYNNDGSFNFRETLIALADDEIARATLRRGS